VHRIVGRVDVQHDLFRRRLEGGDEGLHQNCVNRPRPALVGPVLEAAQRRRAGQGPVAPGRGLQAKIVAQIGVVVQVLVTQHNPEDPLAQQIRHAMAQLAPLARIAQPARHCCHETEPAIRLAQQQRTAVLGESAAANRLRSATDECSEVWMTSNGMPWSSYSCGLRLEDRTGKGYLRLWWRGAFVTSGEIRSETNFYPNPTGYASAFQQALKSGRSRTFSMACRITSFYANIAGVTKSAVGAIRMSTASTLAQRLLISPFLSGTLFFKLATAVCS